MKLDLTITGRRPKPIASTASQWGLVPTEYEDYIVASAMAEGSQTAIVAVLRGLADTLELQATP